MSLGDTERRILLFQCAALLVTWFFFGMEFTAPADIKSSDWPTLSRIVGVDFSAHIPASWLLLFALTVMPLTEELSFRGPFRIAVFSRSFTDFMEQNKWHFWLLVIASGLLFGLLHTNYALPWRLLTAFFGASWVWLVLKHKKLWPTIRLHYFWNIVLASIELLFSPYLREELAGMITF